MSPRAAIYSMPWERTGRSNHDKPWGAELGQDSTASTAGNWSVITAAMQRALRDGYRGDDAPHARTVSVKLLASV